jgi:hypothetical protein
MSPKQKEGDEVRKLMKKEGISEEEAKFCYKMARQNSLASSVAGTIWLHT